MRRFIIFDTFNTWYDWRCTLESKAVSEPAPKTNYVDIGGTHGTLDLTEALTGEVSYGDRTISATLLCSEGTRQDRERLLRQITQALHGKKVKIIEPDDPDHYFLGRVAISEVVKHAAYMQIVLEAVCEPWRYALEETHRTVVLSGGDVSVVIRNNGAKTLSPTLAVTGTVDVTYNDASVELTEGIYSVADIKLRQGANVVTVAGNGSITFSYREAGL